ncbi:hypothetical protein GFS31_19830 [Leptolyngbya sp. BL0902]|uniref:hypothetical protein n=1 Tax=Leptolyngbya sp. BL0902 TaxID=1115757 RepID=UPI0018E8FE9F|nr:hypothetical protein [Leptolyngbya sp. BL0902]QQE65297.1 hypothetical protein GFS31_19830 [Leptolyngbya sp. BL0902]
MIDLDITSTRVEELIVSLGEEGEEVLSGYTITGTLADGRTLWLADVTANTHPAMEDLDIEENLSSPTVEEAQVIAHLLAAAPQMQSIILALATEAIQNDGRIDIDHAVYALEVLASLSEEEIDDSDEGEGDWDD